jgi:hypothetical protein
MNVRAGRPIRSTFLATALFIQNQATGVICCQPALDGGQIYLLMHTTYSTYLILLDLMTVIMYG